LEEIKMPISLLSKLNLKMFLTKWGSIFATIVLFLIFTVLMPKTFLTESNMVTILRSISVTTVIAIGLTMTLAVGGFDLSSGQTATMAGSLIISMMLWFNMSFWLSSLVSIIIIVLLNLIAALMIIKFNVPDLLTTLGMMFFYDGLAMTYAGGGSISISYPTPWGIPTTLPSWPQVFKDIGKSPYIIIIMLLCVLIVHILLTYTRFGRFIYATGGNKEAARLSGVPVNRYRLYSCIIATIFIALGGFLVVSRNSSAQIQGANGYGMPAISAVFIGRSVAGINKPNAIGTLIGAVLVGILENGLIMYGLPYYSINMVKGMVLMIALAVAYASTKG